jgi:YHS domain-containing protein
MSYPKRLPKIDFRRLYFLTGGVLIAFAALSADDSSGPQQSGTNSAGKKAAESEPKTADKSPAPRDAKTALGEFNSLVGAWRGVGMPRRNSQSGAWSETAEWVWNFDKGVPTVHYNIKDGKLLSSAVVGWNAEKQTYQLHAVFTDKQERDYTGTLAENKFVLDSNPDDAGFVHRITLTRLNPKRTVVLVEKRSKDSTFFNRVAEIGYTRQGTSLAVAGSNEPECIVTGGKGTMTVSYKGQTYYVCCTGCKQAFDDDPEGTIIEYKRRLAAKSAGKKE